MAKQKNPKGQGYYYKGCGKVKKTIDTIKKSPRR